MFNKFRREDLRGFWCDGAAIPADLNQLSKKSVNDKRKIETKAWIGKDGQTQYQLTIFLGKYALSKYANGTDMIECIPDDESLEWLSIDTMNKTMGISLK